MAFQKGNKLAKGRPPGSPNKIPAMLKDCILEAAKLAGERLDAERANLIGGLTVYLTAMAIQEPSAFCSLLGKVLPSTLNEQIANKGYIKITLKEEVVWPVGSDGQRVLPSWWEDERARIEHAKVIKTDD